MGSQTPLLITGSPTEIHIHVYTNDIKKNSTDSLSLKKTTYHHKMDDNRNMESTIAGSMNCYGNILQIKVEDAIPLNFVWDEKLQLKCN